MSFCTAQSAAPEEEPAIMPSCAFERLCIADLDYLVHKRHIHGLGNKIVSDSLDVVITVFAAAHGRTDGISHNAADGGVLLL